MHEPIEHQTRTAADRDRPRRPTNSGRRRRPRRQRRQRRLRRRQDQGPRRARSGPQAAGHVHRLDRAGRAAPSGLRSRRQLDRRSAGRLLRSNQRHDPHRRLGHRHRQRPRHSGRSARERQVGGRSRADRAARRRQVRQRQLQSVRRPARRRRLRRQRAVGNARSRNLAQRPGLPAELRARHTRPASSKSPARRSAAARRSRSSPTPRSSRPPSSASTRSRSACASSRS